MPAVWLDRDECRDLPPVCMICGNEAIDTSRQTFRWHPPWVIVLILAGVLIWAIVALILTKTMIVDAPVCGEHKGHWFKRKLLVWVAILVGFAALIVGIVVVVEFGNNPRYEDYAIWGLLAGAVGFLICLICGVIVHRSMIRPIEITDDEIRLTNINEEFIDAVRDQREEERERRSVRRRKRVMSDDRRQDEDY